MQKKGPFSKDLRVEIYTSKSNEAAKCLECKAPIKQGDTVQRLYLHKKSNKCCGMFCEKPECPQKYQAQKKELSLRRYLLK